jgi:hypothetical protein
VVSGARRCGDVGRGDGRAAGAVRRGPRVAPAAGCVVYRDEETGELVKEFGEVTVASDGAWIRVLPRRDADLRDVRLLLGCAELAFRERPSRAHGWVTRRQDGRGYWRSTILRDVDQHEAEASAFRSAVRRMDAVARLLDAASSTCGARS